MTTDRNNGVRPVVAPPLPFEDEHDPVFWPVLLLGLVTVLFGVLVLIWPAATVALYAAVLSIWLLLAGGYRVLVALLPARGLIRRLASTVVGTGLVVLGVGGLRDLDRARGFLALLVGLIWLLTGVAELLLATLAAGSVRAGLVVLGLASSVLAVVLLVRPAASLATLVLCTAIGAFAIGVSEIVFALRMRRSGSATIW